MTIRRARGGRKRARNHYGFVKAARGDENGAHSDFDLPDLIRYPRWGAATADYGLAPPWIPAFAGKTRGQDNGYRPRIGVRGDVLFASSPTPSLRHPLRPLCVVPDSPFSPSPAPPFRLPRLRSGTYRSTQGTFQGALGRRISGANGAVASNSCDLSNSRPPLLATTSGGTVKSIPRSIAWATSS